MQFTFPINITDFSLGNTSKYSHIDDELFQEFISRPEIFALLNEALIHEGVYPSSYNIQEYVIESGTKFSKEFIKWTKTFGKVV